MKRWTLRTLCAVFLCLLLASLTNYASSLTAAAPSITSFAASPAAIAPGASSTLTAVFANGTGFITPGNIAISSGSPVTVTPALTTLYTLVVTNAAGVTAMSSATITVTPPAPVITSFTVGTSSILPGASTTLTAVFSNGNGYIEPGNLAVTSGVPVTVTPLDTTKYTLVVVNSAGVLRANAASVGVAPATPVITSFTAGSASILSGASTTLTAVFSNGSGFITPGNLAVTSGTPVTVTPPYTTKYTLTIINAAGVSRSANASVGVAPATPAITSFTASPSSIAPGASSALTAVFANGTGVIMPGNIAVTNGTPVTVKPTDTTTYTLDVYNSAGVYRTSWVVVNVATGTQTITFANPGAQTVGTPLTLKATASSGLTVSFASTTSSVCTVSGTTATFVAAGSCSITASQAGNATYAAATPVSQSFTVSGGAKTAQTITFANPGTQTVGTPLTLSATATSGLTVAFASTTASVCTVSGTAATFVAAGTCTIQATQAGNSTYAAATPVSQSFTVTGTLPSSGAPLILYTDLLSGPTSGGENNNGTYLSIFGQNFGASGLGTTTKVYIGGVEVVSYRYLGVSFGRPDVQQITVQVGALSGLTQGTAYPIKVQVNGVNSTSYTAQTFTPNPGRILFVSLSGNDATAAVNDINHPWGDIQASTWDSSHTSGAYGAWGAAQPGDVIVFRGGTYTMQGFNDGGNLYFCKFFYGPLGSAPTGAAKTGPIAITSYPAETVIIQPPQSTTYGVFAGVNSQYYVDGNNNPTMSQWITFSNLKIVGGTEDGPISLNVMSNHWRVVNTDLSNPLSAANAGGVSGDGNYIEVLGNNIHDIGGNSSLQDHGIYIDSGANYELAYNEIGNITGGNGIQTYNSGSATAYIDNVNIHHNMIHDIAKHGINIADTSRNGFTVWSNVVYNTAGGCVRLNTTDITGAKIWNNTFYNCNTNGNYAALMNDWSLSSGAISYTNNIVWPSTASGNYLGGSVGFSSGQITGNKNGWYNGTDNSDVSFDANALFTNPLFASISTPDFRLQSTSPALNSGDTSVSSLVTSSYDASPLPSSSGYYNRGALWKSAGAAQSQTISFTNPGAQTVGTPLSLSATASSGLAVSFASTTASVCTVSGTTATFVTAGSCTIQATQAGNSTYAAATPVSQSFTVNTAVKTSQTITFNNPGAQTEGTPLTLSATATSGLTVSFASTTTSVCTVSGTTATFVATGACTIQATQAGNSAYTAATPVSQSFTVNAATPSGSAITLIGNQILDIDGNRIVGRGPEMVSASPSNVSDIDTIAGWGANGLRILITLDAANGMTPAGFDSIVGEAVKKHMLVWLSLYSWNSAANYAIGDALGGGNLYSLTAPAGTGTCSGNTAAPCYLAVWQRQWLKDLVAKYQSNIIIDGMQEFAGAVSDPSTEAARQEWETAAKTNIAFFRSAGYTQPIEIMTNFQGRDLYAIHEYGDSIRSTDTVKVSGYPQTMFGWQAYWGTTDGYYPSYQGALFYPNQNKTLSGTDAIHLFATQEDFPIEIGIDNYGGDTNLDYKAEIDQSATDNATWLWWSYSSSDVECPVSGATCSAYVLGAPNGFGGASPLTAP